MSHATNPAAPAAYDTAAIAADKMVGPLPGYRIGLDLMRATVGDTPTYDLADHDAVGLPMIYSNILIGGEPGAGKSSLLNTLVGHAALIECTGSCWCATCAELRGDPDV